MKKKCISLCMLVSCLILTTTRAQVTIGSTGLPTQGSLLQLKENNNLDVNAVKGLGLPRVQLTNVKPTTATELSQSIGNTGSWDMNSHIGLLIFNAKENRCLPKPILTGMYVWTGTEWRFLNAEEVSPDGVFSFTDQRDGESYVARNFGAVAGNWMLENLRYNPVLHPNPSFTGFTESAASAVDLAADKFFYYPTSALYTPSGSEPANWTLIKQNGLLYNWAAATNGQNASTANQAQSATGTDPTPLTQGICPEGWHLPSDKEWNDLEKEIFENAPTYSTYPASLGTWQAIWGTTSDYRPKDATEGQCFAMRSQCLPYNMSGNAVNGKSLAPSQGGFNVLPVGYANSNAISGYSSISYIWSASSVNPTQSWLRYLSSGSEGVRRGQYNRTMLNSVRCKKN